MQYFQDFQNLLYLFGNEDKSKWNAIQRLIDPNFRAEPGSNAKRRGKRGGIPKRFSRKNDFFR